MEVDGNGDVLAVSPRPACGKKRPLSPSISPNDVADSPKSTTSDEDDNPWVLSDDEEEGEYHGTYRPFTVDDFPRVSSDDDEQRVAVYSNPEISIRGPRPIRRFPAFKPESRHSCDVEYRLADESEISFSNVGTVDCSHKGHCMSMDLVQFIDLKIAGYHHTQPGCAKIFGFFAARDRVEPLRNYVYRREIDNYEAVTVKPKTGMARLSLTSPARGIGIRSRVLFEFKLCICTEGPPEDGPKGDLIIEGCTEFSNMYETKSSIQNRRLYGDKCSLDVKFAALVNAVQAFVDVKILRAPDCGLNLNIYAKTSGYDDVIRLYQGVAEAGCKISSVVAVVIRSCVYLRIEGTPKDDGLSQKLLPCGAWEDRFDTCYHGIVDKVVNLDEFTTILVKITWRTLE
ncbi:uncharacterized protein LOC123395420 [Hordeum vulgare subsp. vulgare]|uniref:Predicted protein n=1 Tax=Hordeum vulgare subsp. vulgare TaxID=112509 RepID=F2E557_HORVV|nr:uncharacterized protein LOC123395420 [Hordeum vulgare subsp. vulgare]BAK02479.1 predicted protein [Hordeum vulgare subsp. vulgare]